MGSASARLSLHQILHDELARPADASDVVGLLQVRAHVLEVPLEAWKYTDPLSALTSHHPLHTEHALTALTGSLSTSSSLS